MNFIFPDGVHDTVIKKWRKICAKYSNGKRIVDHDHLQKAIKEWQKKNEPNKKPMGHKLIKDSKIKWGSLVTSLESGIKIRPLLEEFLEYSTLKLSSEEWDVMEKLVEVLGPIKETVESICRADADLLEAEVVIKELFEELKSNGSPLAMKLLAQLKIEIKKRWKPDIVGVIKYLTDSEKYPPSRKGKKATRGKVLDSNK